MRLQALRTFATTTRQDEELLRASAGGGQSFEAECLQLAVRYRLQHKRAIARGYKVADACLGALQRAVASGSTH